MRVDGAWRLDEDGALGERRSEETSMIPAAAWTSCPDFTYSTAVGEKVLPEVGRTGMNAGYIPAPAPGCIRTIVLPLGDREVDHDLAGLAAHV